METLIFLEEVLLDVWESADTREAAISRLRYVCRTRDTDDGYLCYTWGLLEYHRGNYSESYTAFRKALEKNPNDSLYKNMLRISAEKSGNIADLKAHSRDGEALAVFTETQKLCRENKPPEFVSFQLLAERGILTKESLRRGVLADCFQRLNDVDKSNILKEIRLSSISYKERLYADQMKSDPFSKIWDTANYHRGESGKEAAGASAGVVSVSSSLGTEAGVPLQGTTLKSGTAITDSWKKVKLASASGNEAQARDALRSFLSEIQIAKRKGKLEGQLALALERAAKLLLEQDPQYAKLRFLAKEL
ncbi:tetratricopeptide repeat protein [Leptospira sp. 2 VSF19]|uniref:Tetratricopeptide repeat protein n=1 Tax=Leptospira soteropolitanensis TaxID=2950025 RepID=A0AAW5VPI8_9LEPT|nr:tetratricopeptide repeat protein [Leptospira soteropolitanensis]MCW7501611.1 tetratricopeptide repeat protein [Leptospira soteropolitanensis]MCW7523969.1 tetratricopeptide repeat protein [Leptospira soteropolitanensis]MCW7527834.1 tetratricopeptide repeat protein [Leptospira soteropolitanensis]MCW7531581.1 tetratricopeptide repeat protein [Leptospira soteropolitanensis]